MNEIRCFNSDVFSSDKICRGMKAFFNGKRPVIACVGTDATIGDSLGPICGTMLKEAKTETFIYGTLDNPLTAKEISAAKEYFSIVHPFSPLLVVDAAVGKSEDVGTIKIIDGGIRPGLGADKDLPEMGNVSIIGIVNEKSIANYSFLNLTRLNPVYQMAKIVSRGIIDYLTAV